MEEITRVASNQKEIIMSAAQQLRQEGIYNIAKNMLKKGCEINFI
jgi:hypothetical protein